MPAMLACLAVLPSAAGAAVSVPAPAGERIAAVETTVADAVAPLGDAAADVAQAAQPAPSGIAPPGDQSQARPVEETIAPIAHAAAAPVQASAAPAVLRKSLDERARPHTSHIAATASGERMGSGRFVHGHGLHGATRHPSSERSVAAHRAPSALTDTPTAPHATAEPAAQDAAPAASAPGAAASGGSGGFFFGGGFALVVASLLLMGPRLRRQLSLLPAVCRPAAFLVVLERPG
jgi:hypothetical protein